MSSDTDLLYILRKRDTHEPLCWEKDADTLVWAGLRIPQGMDSQEVVCMVSDGANLRMSAGMIARLNQRINLDDFPIQENLNGFQYRSNLLYLRGFSAMGGSPRVHLLVLEGDLDIESVNLPTGKFVCRHNSNIVDAFTPETNWMHQQRRMLDKEKA